MSICFTNTGYVVCEKQTTVIKIGVLAKHSK